jgi:hypothetical protein
MMRSPRAAVAAGILAVTLALAPAAAAQAVTLPSGSLTGTIRDANGAALDAARLFLSSGSHQFDVTAAADGTYSLTGMPAGEYFIQYVPPATSTGLALIDTYVTVPAGGMILNPVIPFQSTIEGVVTDGVSPVESVLVAIRTPDGEYNVSNGGAGTANDGLFDFSVNPGEWYVSYAPEQGSDLAYQWYTGADLLSAATPFVLDDVASGSPFTADVVLATTTTQITGQVTLGGVPQPNFYLDLLDAEGVAIAGLHTDGTGTYSTAGVPTGTYTLRASDSVGGDDYISQAQAVAVGTSDVVAPALVLVPDPGIVVTGGADAYSVQQDALLARAAGAGVLVNDTRSPAGELFATVEDVPVHGDLFLQYDGGFSYAPDAGYSGPDTFTYIPNRFFPGFGGSGAAVTVSITVQAVLAPTGSTLDPAPFVIAFLGLGVGVLLVVGARRRAQGITSASAP